MDFTRKARLVAGGHLTNPPEALTYLSVVSCDSVRLAFMLAKLNGLHMIMTNIGNAYLNAEDTEKYYAIAGPEFGELQGRTVVVVRALYGLKSAGLRGITISRTNSCDSNSNLFRPIPTSGVAPSSSRTEPSTTITSSYSWMIYYASLWILLGALFNP